MDACDWTNFDIQPEHIRRARQGYFANISYLDDKIGEIFAALEASRQEAIVVFVSDHGDMLGRGPVVQDEFLRRLRPRAADDLGREP